MIHVSFAMTSEAFADCSKTETRRFWKSTHARKFMPGVIFMGITKDFRAGGVRMHPARVVFCHEEPLRHMDADSFHREGGFRYCKTKAEYVEMMGGPDKTPWVLRFEHLPNGKLTCTEPLSQSKSFGAIEVSSSALCSSGTGGALPITLLPNYPSVHPHRFQT